MANWMAGTPPSENEAAGQTNSKCPLHDPAGPSSTWSDPMVDDGGMLPHCDAILCKAGHVDKQGCLP